MAEIERYCSGCGKIMSAHWSHTHCPICGGRVKVNFKQKRVIEKPRPKPVREEPPKKEARKRPIVPVRHTTFSVEAEAAKDTRFLVMSPFLLFLQNAVTFGIRSVFWIYFYLPTLLTMVKPEERIKRSTLYIWLVPYFCMVILFVWGAWELFLSIGDFANILDYDFTRMVLFCMVVSFLVNRYILFWLRRVVMDELFRQTSASIRVPGHIFAPSPFLLWFVGTAYMQLHINRMVKKNVLS